MARYLGRGFDLKQLERIAKVPYNSPPVSMVKGKATIAVGSAAELLHASADQAMKTIKKHDGVKADGAWRYPNNQIVRHEQAVINGRHYYDERDQDQPRRKIESNFFITLNTNRQFRKDDAQMYQAGMRAMEQTLAELAKDRTIKRYLKFGPKSAWYAADRYDDVVQSVEFTGRAETGEVYERLHVHIWLTIKHFSQLQIDMKMMQRVFKELYNARIEQSGDPRSYSWKIGRQPYIQVKLLPTSDWAMVLQQYIQKGMHQQNAGGTSTVTR